MPLRKKIPSLKDLCIDDIIRNIVIHGEMFKRHRDQANEEVCVSYKTLQFLFSDDLLKRFFHLLLHEGEDKKLRALRDVVLDSEEKQPECNRYLPCLELFFNEHTSTIWPYWNLCVRYDLSYSTKEKNILRWFIKDRLYDAIPRFQNLRKVNLSFSADSKALKMILQACPLIKYVSAEVHDTDLLFLSLCKHHSFQEEFMFCPENGKCSKAGKHLEHLHVMLMETTVHGTGIACALQHLPLLKSFYSLLHKPRVWTSGEVLDVCKGIFTLQNAVKAKEQVTLKLSVLYFHTDLNPRQLRDVLMSCPYLETIQVNLSVVNPQIFTLGSFKNLKELGLFSLTNETLNSPELKQFLSIKGKEIETIMLGCGLVLDILLINNILHPCINLKSLSFEIIYVDVRSCSNVTSLPSCIGKLEDIVLDMSFLCSPHPQHISYFHDLLCNAKSLTRLTVASSLAEKVFLKAFDETCFKDLQEFVFISNKIGDFPYLRLLEAKNSLRNIIFWNNQRISTNIILSKEFVRLNNYEVEFLEALGNY